MNHSISILERVAHINRFIVRHPEFNHAFHGITECMQKSQTYQEPIGSILHADGGHGKTLLCRAIIKQMPSYTTIVEGYEKTIIPAFYAQVPSPASVKSVASMLLKELGDPNPASGNTTQISLRLCHLLRQCETKLVFLDEFHHLFRFQKTTTKLNIVVCDWIKSIVNETQISFCLVGLSQFVPLLEMDSQLTRRFQYHYPLHALTIGSSTSYGSMFPFLAEVENQIKTRCEVTFDQSLNSPLITTQLYAATAGNPAFIMTLIKDSVLFALKDNREIITTHDFSNAWLQGTTAKVSLTKSDPFKMSRNILASQMRITL